jgi:polysaccharide export outer membrane protein
VINRLFNSSGFFGLFCFGVLIFFQAHAQDYPKNFIYYGDDPNFEEGFFDDLPEEENCEENNGRNLPESYRLKIGDILLLGVYDEPHTIREVTVGPTGSINFLMARSVPAEGRTIAELRKDLMERLKTYYKEPILTITGTNFIGDHFYISGEVNNPGKKPILGEVSLLKALSLAGGFTNRLYRNQTIDVVDFNHSFLSRNGKYVPVDFERLIRYGDLSQNVNVRSGDYIFMATYVMPKVYILGEVNRPTTIAYLDTISLAEALAEAGGLALRASSRAYVIRGSLSCPVTYCIDVNRMLKAYACNFWLEPGDIVYVPSMKFAHLKEILQGGVSSFISLLATIAGTNVFLEITPKAKVTGVTSPVPVIGSTTSGSTGVFVPTTAPAAGGSGL